MLRIGPYQITNRVVLAPMAGVTDRPFRLLCRRLGAGLAVSEMVSSDARLRDSRKSRLRRDHSGEPEPRSVQIAGADPGQMAAAAAFNVERGAHIIDINMGCPAKKVCRRAAGSALLRDETLVREILRAVVAAVDVPVSLKIRTGWSPQERNGVDIARIAEEAGIAALTVHGRTRACRFEGPVEHRTTAAIVDAVSIPVIANGDIDSPEAAQRVLLETGAAAVMVGRAACGRPWLPGQIDHWLRHGEHRPEPVFEQQRSWMLELLQQLHDFYGPEQGLRIARKHIGWWLALSARQDLRSAFNQLRSADAQVAMLRNWEPDPEVRAA